MQLHAMGIMPGVELAEQTLYDENTSQLLTISKTDLENTDIYIYRVSTGQRIAELEGLADPGGASEIDGGLHTGYNGASTYRGVHENETTATFGFTSLVLGARDFDSSGYMTRLHGQEDAKRNPWRPCETGTGGFEQKPSFLRPGEQLKLIAINRATGYIGSSTMYTQPNNVVAPTPINMYPPNLKIVATRDFEDKQGLTQGTADAHHYNLIGSEGAGLTSDNYVQIRTIWLDHDGTPLPEDLPGYSGRVAISTGNGTQDFSGNFAIKPGYNTEFVQLNNASDLTTEHFYVQVVGENFDGTPNFGSAAGGSGKLATRPKYFVPVLVPLLDETTTRAQQNQLAQARRDGVPNLPDAVAPTYYWVYRPEMQFSVFDWKVNEILRTDMDSANIQNIINLDEPMIRETDLVDVLFTLMSPTNAELESIGTPRQLTLSIGGEEIQLTTTDTQITFFDLTHLSQLGSEDYLTIRLYQNNDSFNVLYQFEFKLERVMLADFNRDGQIKFDSLLRDETGARTDVTLESKPFVFWVNNDDDSQASEVKGNDIDKNEDFFDAYIPDHDNNVIDGTRDLIDFAAVGVKLHTFLKNTPEAEHYTFTFKQADSAVNIVYTDMDLDHTNKYQKDLDVAAVSPVFGSWQNATVLTDVPVHNVTSSGINLPTEFIQAISWWNSTKPLPNRWNWW